jgi:predicted outer membrane protein
MKISLVLLGLCWLLAVAAPSRAADSFAPAETQMVRSVLERQATLMRLNALAVQRAAVPAVREIARADTELQTRLRGQLLALVTSLGMQGVEGLPAPGYFQRAESQLQSLSDNEFDQRYLLLALQCHAFLERSFNGEIRTGVSTELVSWVRQHIDALEARSREIDHALYDLK